MHSVFMSCPERPPKGTRTPSPKPSTAEPSTTASAPLCLSPPPTKKTADRTRNEQNHFFRKTVLSSWSKCLSCGN